MTSLIVATTEVLVGSALGWFVFGPLVVRLIEWLIKREGR